MLAYRLMMIIFTPLMLKLVTSVDFGAMQRIILSHRCAGTIRRFLDAFLLGFYFTLGLLPPEDTSYRSAR